MTINNNLPDDGWDTFEQDIDRLEARNNSILFAALDAALDAAFRTYRDRRDAVMDIHDASQRGSPEHLNLLREYQAAEKQIKAWCESLMENDK